MSHGKEWLNLYLKFFLKSLSLVRLIPYNRRLHNQCMDVSFIIYSLW